MKSEIEQIETVKNLIIVLWSVSSKDDLSKMLFEDFLYKLGETIGDDDLFFELEFLIDVNNER